MILRRGYYFLLKPTAAQHQFLRVNPSLTSMLPHVRSGLHSKLPLLACSAGCARLVWNTALALQKQRLTDKLPRLSYDELCKLLPLWKKEKPFLKEAPSQPLQQRLKDLSQALSEALDAKNPKQFPVFKKKGEDDSFRYPQHIELSQERSKIELPKLGWVRYVNSRKIVGKVKNVTITQEAGRWHISIQTEQEIDEPKHPSTSIVGGDLGVAHFLTLSDGTHYDSPDYKPLEDKIKSAQRKLANKHKGGKNYHKQRIKLQRANKRLRDKRACCEPVSCKAQKRAKAPEAIK